MSNNWRRYLDDDFEDGYQGFEKIKRGPKRPEDDPKEDTPPLKQVKERKIK